jgi:hypothetical protein
MSALSSARRMRARGRTRARRRGGPHRVAAAVLGQPAQRLLDERPARPWPSRRAPRAPSRPVRRRQVRAPSGSETVNVVPRRRSLSTPIVPPCSLTSSCTSARPMPDPSWCARAPSTRWKRSNTRGSSSSGMPTPVSRTASSTRPPRRAARRDRAVERELEGVRQQVEDDLLPHLAIDVDRLGSGGQSTTSSGRRARSPSGRRSPDRRSARRGRSARNACGAAGLDAREVEQRVDQLQQPQLVAVTISRSSRSERAAGAASASSVGPSISVSGVRNSWLTLLKNAVFARSISASASARCAPLREALRVDLVDVLGARRPRGEPAVVGRRP